jgi:hypothetical protein
MRNLTFLSVALLALLLSLACCKKNAVNPSASGSVSFKIDSLATFTSASAGGVWEPTNSLLNITAKGGRALIVLNLLMPNGLKAGTYPFSSTSTAATATFYRPDTLKTSEGYYSNVDTKSFGSLVITSVTADSLVTGTFTYSLKDPVSGVVKKLTAGVITKVKIINNKSIVSVGSNVFSAKIDGSLFTPTQITALKSSGSLIIGGSDGTKSVGLNVPETIAAGNYTLSFGTNYTGQFLPSLAISNGLYIASAATSKLTILENNTTTKLLRGTFNFKGEDSFGSSTKTYLITEGSFSVKY